MKTIRSLWRALAVVAVILMGATAIAVQPAWAADIVVLKASGAQGAAGQGSAVDIGAYRSVTVMVTVTAGSGTVNPFRVWLEGSPDAGVTWYELPCYQWVKTAAAVFTHW